MAGDMDVSYKNGAVEVDSHFARFGSKSYAVKQINTVDVRYKNPHGKIGMIIFGVISLIFLLATMGSIARSHIDIVSFFAAAAFGWLAYWRWQRSKIVEYSLFLTTSSGSVHAYTTQNLNEIIELRKVIEAAAARSI